VAPDVVLDNAGSGIDKPIGLVVTDRLFVANQDADTITIYNAPDTLASGDAPDVTLDILGSFIRDPNHVFVIDNVLYVTTGDDSDDGSVSAFSPADGLTDGQAPDWSLGPPNKIPDPLSVAIVGNRIWFGSSGFPAGLLGFDNPTAPGPYPAAVIPTGDNLNVPALQQTDEIVSFAGTLWGAGADAGVIFAYLDPDSVASDQFPDLILTHPSMGEPKALHIEERP